MRIAVRFEGGLGDHILAARFLPAVKDKHPDARITIYSDTQGNTFQSETLRKCYGHLFDEIRVIQSKKYGEFWVDCQFGIDNYYGAIENVPDEVRKEMTESYDKFYDFHIDGLKWMNSDIDWLRCFYHFPRPDAGYIKDLPQDYTILHLKSMMSESHAPKKFWIDAVMEEIHKTTNVVVISNAKDNHLYEPMAKLLSKGSNKVILLNNSIYNIAYAIKNARMMFAIDSGFKYFGYAFGVPTITFSKICTEPGRVHKSHEIRWLPFPNTVYPVNYNVKEVGRIARRVLSNRGWVLSPSTEDFDTDFVNRKYTINIERSKKNNELYK